MGLFQLSGSPAGTVDTTRTTGVGPNLQQPVLGQLTNTLNGSYLFGGQGFNQAQQAASNRIIPQVNSMFGAAGRSGSGLAQSEMTRQLGDSFAGLYNNERNRQIQAAGIAPNVDGTQTLSEPYFENDLATALGLLGGASSLFGGEGGLGGLGGILSGAGNALGLTGPGGLLSGLFGLGGSADTGAGAGAAADFFNGGTGGGLDLSGASGGTYVANGGGAAGGGGVTPPTGLSNLLGSGAAIGAGIGASGAAMTPAGLSALGLPALGSSLASGGSLGLAASGPLGAGLGGGASPAVLAGLEAAAGGTAAGGAAAGGAASGATSGLGSLAGAAIPLAGLAGMAGLISGSQSRIKKSKAIKGDMITGVYNALGSSGGTMNFPGAGTHTTAPLTGGEGLIPTIDPQTGNVNGRLSPNSKNGTWHWESVKDAQARQDFWANERQAGSGGR